MAQFFVAQLILLWGIGYLTFFRTGEQMENLEAYSTYSLIPKSATSHNNSNPTENPHPSEGSPTSPPNEPGSNPENPTSSPIPSEPEEPQQPSNPPETTPQAPNETETSSSGTPKSPEDNPQPENPSQNPSSGNPQTPDKPETPNPPDDTPQTPDHPQTSEPPAGNPETPNQPPEATNSSSTPQSDPTGIPQTNYRQKGHEADKERHNIIARTAPSTALLSRDSDNTSNFVFKSNLQNGSQCHQKGFKTAILCKLGLSNNCKRRGISQELSTFWIVCPIYSANHKTAAKLYELHRNFRNYIKSYGINFQTVEVIFPGQKFQLTQPNNQPYDLQYRDDWIFAMRENLVNVGIRHLPDDWQYISWIDQHIFWPDAYWFEKAIWLMSHHKIVQLLNGSDFWDLNNKTTYHLNGIALGYYTYGSECWRYVPQQWGLAWATRRELVEKAGGLLDVCIGTKCDMYQVFSYIGLVYTDQTSNAEYANMIGAWQERARDVYQKDIGFINVTVLHFMHCYDNCRTSDYDQQISMLMQHNYRPTHDLVRDGEGRLSLVNNLPLARALWVIYGGDARDENDEPQQPNPPEFEPEPPTNELEGSILPLPQDGIPQTNERQSGHEEGKENRNINTNQAPLEELLSSDVGSPQFIFESSQNETKCHQKGFKMAILCKLGLSNNCKRRGISQELSTFWIVCPIYSANHKTASKLYELHRNFRNYIKSYGINFQTVEVIFPGQEFQLTQPNNQPYDLQYRDDWIFAMRENLVNVGIRHLPNDWQYISWIDQHIFWPDAYWFEKAIWLMSHHRIVQLLNGSDFLDLNNQTTYHLKGIAQLFDIYGSECWRYGIQQWGLAWATRRELIEKAGGLFDICIGTKCDMYQVYSYIGLTYNKQTDNEKYANMIKKWQEHARDVYQKDVSFLNVTVLHFMHCFENCKTSDYDQQIGILNRHHYDPIHDLVRDAEGRLSLVNNLPLAKDLWRVYGGNPR